MPKPNSDKLFANADELNRTLSFLETKLGDLHQLSIETAQGVVASLGKLSPQVLKETRNHVTAYDVSGRIMNTVAVEVPAHRRDFNAMVRTRMQKFRNASAAGSLGRFYHDILAAVWDKDAYARIQHLASGPDFVAWIAQCDMWKVASSDHPDEPFTMRILRLTAEAAAAA